MTDISATAGGASRKAAEILPKPAAPAANGLRIGGAAVDLGRGRIVAADGTATDLRPKTAAMLRVLARRPGEIVTKDELLDLVWPGLYVDEDGMVQCVGEIRRALGPDRAAIRTHAKRGYALELAAADTARPRGSWCRALARPAAALPLILLLCVAGLAAATLARRGPPAAPPAAQAFRGPAVAVLPFEAWTPGERWDRLARALTEDVIADLAQNSWLFVFADAATRALPAATAEAARGLGATYAVTGSIQIEDDTGRVNAALVDTATGRQIWQTRFEGPADDLLVMQRQASEAVIGELAASWTGPISRADRARGQGKGTDDLGAYDLYLRAGERIASYTADDMAAAEAMLKRVVELDPGFGEAWAKLSLLSYSRVRPEMSEAEMLALWQQGDDAALEAYRVAPDRPNVLGQAANVVRWTDPGKAEGMIRRAAELAPNNADILAYLAFRAAHFPALGPEAEGWIDRAIRLNPARPDWYDWNRGAVMMVLGRYPEAAAAYARAPDHIEARAGHVAALALAGQVDDARARMATLLEDAPDFTPGWYADLAGLHPEVAAVYGRGFALADAAGADGSAGGGGR